MAKIRPRDRAAVLEALQGGSAIRIIQASYGSGKLLPLDTPILTEEGWRPNGSLKVGDRVYTRNGDLTAVTGLFPERGVQVWEMRLADGRRIRCCKDHLWFVISRTVDEAGAPHYEERVMSISDMLDGIDGHEAEFGYFIPTCAPIALEEGTDLVLPSGAHMPNDLGSRRKMLDSMLGDAKASIRHMPLVGEVASASGLEDDVAEGIALVARSLGHVATVGADGEKRDVTVAFDQGRTEIMSIMRTDDVADMQCIAVEDESHSYVIHDFIPSHNTFFLTLTKTVALRRNFVVMSTDFSPDRRLYSTSKKALETYRALIRSMSTMTHPDGGALEELLDALDERIEVRDSEFLSQTRRLVCGTDAVTVIDKWHQSKHPATKAEANAAFHVQDLCLRWFSGEMTPEQKREFGLSETIGDAQAYDALKLIAHLAHCAGYAGTLVEYDECVNLYKINNSTSRDKNYEQILRIFNEAKQGDARYVGFIFGGTPEFVSDTRRGLFSYEALQSRLMPSRFRDRTKDVDTTGPIIDLAPLSQEDLLVLMRRALEDPRGFGGQDVRVDDEQLRAIAVFANGDARSALSTLEMVVINSPADEDGVVRVSQATLEQCVSRKSLLYDKGGEEHYNIISALHKSMRNSDPDAAVYWLARMLEGGEDPLYVARRVTRFAAEDIGLADPRALEVCVAAFQACHMIGMPECTVHLTEAVVYCAMAPKSNALYMAYEHAKRDANERMAEPVPLQLRNAPTALMGNLGYGRDYRYAHNTEEKLTPMPCLPDSLVGTEYFRPTTEGLEARYAEKLAEIKRWKREHASEWQDTTSPEDEEGASSRRPRKSKKK